MTMQNKGQPNMVEAWAGRHINITWAIAVIVSNIFCVGVMFAYEDSSNYEQVGMYMNLLQMLLVGVVTIWALRNKNRSYWWILIPIAVLLLENRRERDEGHQGNLRQRG